MALQHFDQVADDEELQLLLFESFGEKDRQDFLCEAPIYQKQAILKALDEYVLSSLSSNSTY